MAGLFNMSKSILFNMRPRCTDLIVRAISVSTSIQVPAPAQCFHTLHRRKMKIFTMLNKDSDSLIMNRSYCIETPKTDEHLAEPKKTEDACKMSEMIRLKGLPFSATVDDVASFLTDIDIENGIKGIHLGKEGSGRSDGCAYVEVASEDALAAALGRHRQYIGMRYIEVSTVPRSELNNFISVNDDTIYACLKGVSYRCYAEEIVAFFSGLEIASDGIIFTKNNSGKPSGTAYVKFIDSETMKKALKKDREHIGERYIEVFPCRESEFNRAVERDQRTYREPNTGGMYRERSSHSDLGRSYGYDTNSEYRSTYSDAAPQSKYNQTDFQSSTNSIFMRGLPFRASEHDVREFFHPLTPATVTFTKNSMGQPSGNATAQFNSYEETVEGMKKDRNYIGARYVELSMS